MIEPKNALKVFDKTVVRVIAFILTVAVITTSLIVFGVASSYSVNIKADGNLVELQTTEQSVGAVLSAAKVEVDEEDTVDSSDFEVGKDADEGNQIIVYRAAKVKIKQNNEEVADLVAAGTVEDAIKEAGITLSEEDTVNYKLTDELEDGMTIEICTGFPVTVKVDGTTQKIYTHEGRVKDVLDNADITLSGTDSVSPSEDTAVKEGMEIVVTRGTGSTAAKKTEGVPCSYVAVISGRGTAYTAKAGAKTATGLTAARGRVAVDPDQIPYGSELYIVAQDGTVYGYAVACDTGGFAKSGSAVVDLYMDSYSECVQWGSRQVNIYVISWGNGQV